jgi:hypothetical protein
MDRCRSRRFPRALPHDEHVGQPWIPVSRPVSLLTRSERSTPGYARPTANIKMNSPRNGRNITVEMFGKAINSAIGWSSEVGTIPAAGAFKALGLTHTIDLEQLNNRTVGLERPASLCRADDSNDVVPARVQAVMDDSDDKKYLTAASLGASRHRVELPSPLTAAQQSPAQGEAGFILALMMDGTVPAAGTEGVDYTKLKAVKSFAQEWLTFERLPVELGWRPSERQVSLADLAPINAAIKQAQAALN